jgi:YgiT-type zinc finger domain-containing protein
MSEGNHDFRARIEDEIIVIKDVPAMVCDTCGEVEYTLEVSREIDRIRKDLLAGRMRARPLVAGGERINHQQIIGTYIYNGFKKPQLS